MTTYNTYKDSGIAWLGQIPSHWEVKRCRIVLAENTQANSYIETTKQLQFRYGEIVPKANQSVDDGVIETIRKYTVVNKGDIMINGLNLNYDFISQRVAQVIEKGCITSAYIALTPTQIADSRFYTYFLKAMDNIKMFHGMGSGVRLTLSYKELKNMYIPIPPLYEQQAMADYIDEATAKIDEAIAQQQKMIDLLKERKQIIINEAVTHGLDPNVPMKPTGIDWLPQIPAHWGFVRIKNIASVKTGKTPPSEDKHYFDNGTVLWFTPADFDSSNIYLNESQRHITQKAISEKVAFLFPPNSVLMIGIGGTLGRIGFCKNSCFSNQQINAIIVNNNYNPIYLAYYLKSEFDYIWSRANTATMPIINQQATKDLLVTCPPFDEQEIIANEIEMKCLPLNEAISRHKRMISLFSERKQIIINNVVTGKIKVV